MYSGYGRSSCPARRLPGDNAPGRLLGVLQSGQVKGFGTICAIADRLSCRFLLGRLRDETVGYLVDVGIELRKVYAMRSGIRHVSKEAVGQFALDTEVPLLHVSVLLDRITGGREVALVDRILRDIRYRVAPGHWGEVRAREERARGGIAQQISGPAKVQLLLVSVLAGVNPLLALAMKFEVALLTGSM